MKSSIYQIVGCIGSQKFKEIKVCDTMKEAKARAKIKNQEYADMQGKSLRQHLSDLNKEGHFVADRSGYGGCRV
jgi:hypothetical protein